MKNHATKRTAEGTGTRRQIGTGANPSGTRERHGAPLPPRFRRLCPHRVRLMADRPARSPRAARRTVTRPAECPARSGTGEAGTPQGARHGAQERGGRSGRARTRPAHGNATAHPCRPVSGDVPAPVRTVAADRDAGRCAGCGARQTGTGAADRQTVRRDRHGAPCPNPRPFLSADRDGGRLPPVAPSGSWRTVTRPAAWRTVAAAKCYISATQYTGRTVAARCPSGSWQTVRQSVRRDRNGRRWRDRNARTVAGCGARQRAQGKPDAGRLRRCVRQIGTPRRTVAG